jgi:hypothetical protein
MNAKSRGAGPGAFQYEVLHCANRSSRIPSGFFIAVLTRAALTFVRRRASRARRVAFAIRLHPMSRRELTIVDANCGEYLKKLSNPSVIIVESNFPTARTTRSASDNRPRRSTFSAHSSQRKAVPQPSGPSIRLANPNRLVNVLRSGTFPLIYVL